MSGTGPRRTTISRTGGRIGVRASADPANAPRGAFHDRLQDSQSPTALVSVPIPSMVSAITSPGFIACGGTIA
jgi:hypothetical protein